MLGLDFGFTWQPGFGTSSVEGASLSVTNTETYVPTVLFSLTMESGVAPQP